MAQYKNKASKYTSTGLINFARLLSLLALIVLSGCCQCEWGCGGRRPQVLGTYAPCVIDYEFSCGCDGCLEEDEDDIAERTGTVSPDKLPHKDNEYRFAIGDFVDISVFGEDETTSESIIVAPDGNIYYSFLDAIPAVGRTIPEVSTDMGKKLEHLFINPIVTISLRQATGQIFKILGRVIAPGVYPVVGNMTLREAIGQAGGFQHESYRDKERDSDLITIANLKDSYLVREGKKLNVDFNSIIYGPDLKSNVRIRAGDLIYIASTDSQDVYVLGAVRSPRRVGFIEGMTLMQALGDADGWIFGTPFGADIHSILIVRGPLECPCAMDVDLSLILNGQARDLTLQPGDIIYVHNKELRFGRVLVNIAINSFVQSFATGLAGYYASVRWFPVGN